MVDTKGAVMPHMGEGLVVKTTPSLLSLPEGNGDNTVKVTSPGGIAGFRQNSGP